MKLISTEYQTDAPDLVTIELDMKQLGAIKSNANHVGCWWLKEQTNNVIKEAIVSLLVTAH